MLKQRPTVELDHPPPLRDSPVRARLRQLAERAAASVRSVPAEEAEEEVASTVAVHPVDPPGAQEQTASTAAAIPGGSATFLRSKAGRLVERWVPAGRGAGRARRPGRRRLSIVAAMTGIAVATCTTALLMANGPARETAPPRLPVARQAGASLPSSAAASTTNEPETVTVSVVGKVAEPGLVTLPADARVVDAVRAAGGVLSVGDRRTVNLARHVADGEQLYVGIPRPAGVSVPGSAGDGDAAGAQSKRKIALNTANQQQLETLPGVGEVTAGRIVEWRTEHGGFTAVEQLRDVDGIGPKRFADLRERVQVR